MDNLCPDKPACIRCYGEEDRAAHDWESQWVWKGDDAETDWDVIRAKCALLGLTNYLPETQHGVLSSGTEVDKRTLLTEDEYGLLVKEVEMYSSPQSCLCQLAARRKPNLLDTIKWAKESSAVVNSDGSSWSNYEYNVLSQSNKTPDQVDGPNTENDEEVVLPEGDDNIFLWDLRKSLEISTIAHVGQMTNAITPPKEDVTCKNRKLSTSRKSHQSTSCKQPNPLKIVDSPDDVENNPQSMVIKTTETTGKVKSKKEQHLRQFKKYCKWSFKTCQGKLLDDPSNTTPCVQNATPLVTNHQKRNVSINQKNQPGTVLIVTEDDAYINVDKGIVADSSSCSVTPDSISSDSTQRQGSSIIPDDTTSNETSETSSKSAKSDSIQNLTRIFRRSNPKCRGSSTSFCGYSLERDYCVDRTTDRIFKEFLKPNPHARGETPTFTKRNSSLRNKTTQLRRQVMRKQYSDSAAVYYGQRMRRWRVKKQRSDSVNCPVDRGVLRRQEQIDEEYFPEDLRKETRN